MSGLFVGALAAAGIAASAVLIHRALQPQWGPCPKCGQGTMRPSAGVGPSGSWWECDSCNHFQWRSR